MAVNIIFRNTTNDTSPTTLTNNTNKIWVVIGTWLNITSLTDPQGGLNMQLQVLEKAGGFIMDEWILAVFGTAAATYANVASMALSKKLFCLPNRVITVTGPSHMQLTIAECDTPEEALAIRIT